MLDSHSRPGDPVGGAVRANPSAAALDLDDDDDIMPVSPAIVGDYRNIHLSKGDTYDHALSEYPFDAYLAQREAAILAGIMPGLFKGNSGRYLDFACGTGRITQVVAPYASESYGVDISESMIAVAREKCTATQFLRADLTQRTLDLGQFDVVSSFRFFGNAQPELRRAALQALNRLLRMDGHLVINSHRNPHALASLMIKLGGGEHGMDLTYPLVKRILREAGFRIEQVRPVAVWVCRGKLQESPILRQPMADRLEKWFAAASWAPIAPDAVIVARKVQEV
jgi:ubiquinone/menaquinone biosynthesis C-methylase UbiE